MTKLPDLVTTVAPGI